MGAGIYSWGPDDIEEFVVLEQEGSEDVVSMPNPRNEVPKTNGTVVHGWREAAQRLLGFQG